MSKTMLRIVAIVMIGLIVALSGCVGGDKEPTEVEPTPAPTVAPTVAPTPETPAATPAATPAEDTKEADAGEMWTPKSSDLTPLESSISGCEELDQKLLARCDLDKNGLIDKKEMETAGFDFESSRMTPSDYAQILYAYKHQCSVETE